ncbi:hypothetical protein MKS88_001873 [Plasmodium brasilianum]|uniref:Uncharacterized protein n=1 Tax=Plasmodium brasilianum TaxID=5824 RepID=A0ACB9YCV3_PLABR|nr:hypothetical protein MKS88_001873 [Plasmodium brasilianum]
MTRDRENFINCRRLHRANMIFATISNDYNYICIITFYENDYNLELFSANNEMQKIFRKTIPDKINKVYINYNNTYICVTSENGSIYILDMKGIFVHQNESLHCLVRQKKRKVKKKISHLKNGCSKIIPKENVSTHCYDGKEDHFKGENIIYNRRKRLRSDNKTRSNNTRMSFLNNKNKIHNRKLSYPKNILTRTCKNTQAKYKVNTSTNVNVVKRDDKKSIIKNVNDLRRNIGTSKNKSFRNDKKYYEKNFKKIPLTKQKNLHKGHLHDVTMEEGNVKHILNQRVSVNSKINSNILKNSEQSCKSGLYNIFVTPAYAKEKLRGGVEHQEEEDEEGDVKIEVVNVEANNIEDAEERKEPKQTHNVEYEKLCLEIVDIYWVSIERESKKKFIENNSYIYNYNFHDNLHIIYSLDVGFNIICSVNLKIIIYKYNILEHLYRNINSYVELRNNIVYTFKEEFLKKCKEQKKYHCLYLLKLIKSNYNKNKINKLNTSFNRFVRRKNVHSVNAYHNIYNLSPFFFNIKEDIIRKIFNDIIIDIKQSYVSNDQHYILINYYINVKSKYVKFSSLDIKVGKKRKKVGGQIGGKIGHQIRDQAGKKLGSQMGKKLGSQMGKKLGSQMGKKLGSQIGNKLCSQMGNKLGSQMGSKLGSKTGIKLGSKMGIKLGSKTGIKLGSKMGRQMGDQTDSQLGNRVCRNPCLKKGITDKSKKKLNLIKMCKNREQINKFPPEKYRLCLLGIQKISHIDKESRSIEKIVLYLLYSFNILQNIFHIYEQMSSIYSKFEEYKKLYKIYENILQLNEKVKKFYYKDRTIIYFSKYIKNRKENFDENLYNLFFKENEKQDFAHFFDVMIKMISDNTVCCSCSKKKFFSQNVDIVKGKEVREEQQPSDNHQSYKIKESQVILNDHNEVNNFRTRNVRSQTICKNEDQIDENKKRDEMNSYIGGNGSLHYGVSRSCGRSVMPSTINSGGTKRGCTKNSCTHNNRDIKNRVISDCSRNYKLLSRNLKKEEKFSNVKKQIRKVTCVQRGDGRQTFNSSKMNKPWDKAVINAEVVVARGKEGYIKYRDKMCTIYNRGKNEKDYFLKNEKKKNICNPKTCTVQAKMVKGKSERSCLRGNYEMAVKMGKGKGKGKIKERQNENEKQKQKQSGVGKNLFRSVPGDDAHDTELNYSSTYTCESRDNDMNSLYPDAIDEEKSEEEYSSGDLSEEHNLFISESELEEYFMNSRKFFIKNGENICENCKNLLLRKNSIDSFENFELNYEIPKKNIKISEEDIYMSLIKDIYIMCSEKKCPINILLLLQEFSDKEMEICMGKFQLILQFFEKNFLENINEHLNNLYKVINICKTLSNNIPVILKKYCSDQILKIHSLITYLLKLFQSFYNLQTHLNIFHFLMKLLLFISKNIYFENFPHYKESFSTYTNIELLKNYNIVKRYKINFNYFDEYLHYKHVKSHIFYITLNKMKINVIQILQSFENNNINLTSLYNLSVLNVSINKVNYFTLPKNRDKYCSVDNYSYFDDFIYKNYSRFYPFYICTCDRYSFININKYYQSDQSFKLIQRKSLKINLYPLSVLNIIAISKSFFYIFTKNDKKLNITSLKVKYGYSKKKFFKCKRKVRKLSNLCVLKCSNLESYFPNANNFNLKIHILYNSIIANCEPHMCLILQGF